MHVLHFIDGLGLGGAERMLVDLANATARDGHRVSACVTRADTRMAEDLDRGIELVVLDRRRTLAVRPSLAFARWCRNRRPDIVHVHMRSSLQYMLSLHVAGLVRLPFVFHDHYGRIEADAAIPAWFWVGQRFIGHYVGVHPELSAWAQRAGMPASRTSTIANAIDVSRIERASPIDVRRELSLRDDVAVAVLAASFKHEKGIDMVIEALARMRASDRLHLVIAGGGVESEVAAACRALVRRHGLERHVSILGARADIAGLIRGADIGLLGSYSESGPLVLIEYLAAGLPVVATEVGDIGRRLAAAGLPGFVKARDSEAFARALDDVVAMPTSARRERGAAGRARLADGGFDIRRTMSRWYEVYGAALALRAA